MRSRLEKAPLRLTEDLDVTARFEEQSQWNQVIEALVASGFSQKASHPISIFAPDQVQTDFFLFGPFVEKDEVDLQHTDGTIPVKAHAEVYQAAFTVRIDDAYDFLVASIPGICVLKLLANADNPERVHDLSDIEELAAHYFEIESEHVFEQHTDLMGKYDPDEAYNYNHQVGAHALGRDMLVLLRENDALRPEIEQALASAMAKRKHIIWKTMVAGFSDASAF